MRHASALAASGLALALFVGSCAAPRAAEFPLEEPIEVWVDGHGPFGFGFDSGQSAAVVLTPQLARRLALPRVGRASVGDGSGQNARVVPLLRISRLTLDGTELRDLDAITLEGAQRGSLGFACFAEGLLTLDAARGRARWSPGSLPEPDGRTILPLDLGQGASPSLPIEIEGRSFLAFVDSAWDTEFMLPAALEPELALREPAQVVARVATLFNEFDVREGRLAGEIAIGEQRFSDPVVQFNPLLDHVLLGAGLLRRFEVTFDQRRRRVRLVPAQAP